MKHYASISVTKSTKLKSLIKFHNQTVVLLDQILELKSPQPEPQLVVNVMVVGLSLIKQFDKELIILRKNEL